MNSVNLTDNSSSSAESEEDAPVQEPKINRRIPFSNMDKKEKRHFFCVWLMAFLAFYVTGQLLADGLYEKDAQLRHDSKI